MVCLSGTLEAQPCKTSDPDSIKIVTTDVDNFWNTYDKLGQVHTLNDSIQIVQKYYLADSNTKGRNRTVQF